MKLAQIQQALRAPKSRYMSHTKCYFRNCEDILQAAKPLLGEAIITLNDEVVAVGERLFVKATARFKSDDEDVSVGAFAEIGKTTGAMSAPQTTGSSSTYARKYALGGLLMIDDNKDDPDTQEKTPITMEVLTKEIKDRQVDIEKLSKFLGISSLAELNKNQYAEALEAIKRKPKAENVLEI